jgi:cytidylate kinase
MAMAPDAVEIDTSGLDLDEVIGEIVSLADSRMAGAWIT